uniref:Serine/threonine specific protein phosphatases domain-containing protein n=1 Tax=Eptatretus burgeri TaxID=7764 RepID=A0A8C4QXW6_EPTBU
MPVTGLRERSSPSTRMLESHVAYAATRLFASLPLATVVNRRVLVLHGGLSSNIRLRALHSLPRHQFLSVLRPPVQMDEKGQVSPKFRDWKQLMAVLWSDPTPKAGESDNLARGGGCCFGPDVTLSVLRHHNLSLLIRSHECVPRGFVYQHGNHGPHCFFCLKLLCSWEQPRCVCALGF